MNPPFSNLHPIGFQMISHHVCCHFRWKTCISSATLDKAKTCLWTRSWCRVGTVSWARKEFFFAELWTWGGEPFVHQWCHAFQWKYMDKGLKQIFLPKMMEFFWGRFSSEKSSEDWCDTSWGPFIHWPQSTKNLVAKDSETGRRAVETVLAPKNVSWDVFLLHIDRFFLGE